MKNKEAPRQELPSWLLKNSLDSAEVVARRDAQQTSEEFREIIHDKILKLASSA